MNTYFLYTDHASHFLEIEESKKKV